MWNLILIAGRDCPGFDVNSVGPVGKTAFLFAIHFGKVQTAEFLYTFCYEYSGLSMNISVDTDILEETTLYKTAINSIGTDKKTIMGFVTRVIQSFFAQRKALVSQYVEDSSVVLNAALTNLFDKIHFPNKNS